MAQGVPVSRVAQAINKAVGRVLSSGPYRAWAGTERIRPGDLVILNNSFLYRDGLTTRAKSDKYLARLADVNGQPQPPTVVISSSRIISQFKRVSSHAGVQPQKVGLDDAIKDEVSELGTIVFALVARVAPDEPASVRFAFGKLAELRYEPAQKETAKFQDPHLSLNSLEDIDSLWSAVRKVLAASGGKADAELEEHFEEGLASLQEAAGRPVDLNDVTAGAGSILFDVVTRIDQQVKAYKQALAVHKGKPQALEPINDLLRIAYNFADGAKALLTLVVGISDLKPLLFWLTIDEQSELADRFSELPFALVGKAKPSLERYRSVISAARNRAFHDFFAFARPFHVDLPGEAFRSPELRLFRQFRSSAPALEFRDRQLVELLEGLSRTPESPVPLGFWEKNQGVMESVANLTRAVQKALVLVSRSRHVGGQP
jgi:hypothetical protein